MKKKIKVVEKGKKVEKEVSYIPFRYIAALHLIAFEYLAVLAVIILLTIYVPYFYIAVLLTQLCCAVGIINSHDYEECCKEAKKEQEKGDLPALREYLPSIEQYDRIVLVYPCWWGTCPQAVFTFLKHYKFAGKEILPICTHEGSGMGRSEGDIAHLCKNADLVQGLAICGHKAEYCDEELKRILKVL